MARTVNVVNSYDATSEAVLVVFERRVDFPTLREQDKLSIHFSQDLLSKEGRTKGNPAQIENVKQASNKGQRIQQQVHLQSKPLEHLQTS